MRRCLYNTHDRLSWKHHGCLTAVNLLSPNRAYPVHALRQDSNWFISLWVSHQYEVFTGFVFDVVADIAYLCLFSLASDCVFDVGVCVHNTVERVMLVILMSSGSAALQTNIFLKVVKSSQILPEINHLISPLQRNVVQWSSLSSSSLFTSLIQSDSFSKIPFAWIKFFVNPEKMILHSDELFQNNFGLISIKNFLSMFFKEILLL